MYIMDGYNIGLFQRKSKQGGGLGYTFLTPPPPPIIPLEFLIFLLYSWKKFQATK